MSRLRWGGSTPNHPAALRLGTQMGSDSPGQHEYIFFLEVSYLDPENHTRHTRRGEVSIIIVVASGIFQKSCYCALKQLKRAVECCSG